MTIVNILTSAFFLSVADRLMDILWLTLAINFKIDGNKGPLVGVLMQMIILRIVLYVLIKKLFNKFNFYGLYIFGLTAAFVIILIGTKNENITLLIFLVAAKEIFSMFRMFGNKGVGIEVFGARRRVIHTVRILSYASLLPAYLILMYYVNNNIINSIFASLAILVGLPTIFMYKGFSKKYAKKGINKVDQIETKFTRTSMILNIISAVSIPAFYTIFIFAKENTLLLIGIVSLVSVLLETLKAVVIKEKLSFEIDTVIYSSIYLTALLAAIFVV